MHRSALLVLVLLAACKSGNEPPIGNPPKPGQGMGWEDHELQERWQHEGAGEAWALAAADLNGDGSDDVVYGGRGLVALDGITREVIWTVPWPKPAQKTIGGDNDWAPDVEITDLDGDGAPDVLALTSQDEAFAIDGATGEVIWSITLDLEWFTDRVALFDGDDDGIADFFPSGGYTAYSGATGAPLWDVDTPMPISFPLAAQLDDDAELEIVLVRELDEVIGGSAQSVPVLETAVYAHDNDGTLLWAYAPERNVIHAVAADIDGDGLDDVVVAQEGQLEALTDSRRLWRATVDGIPVAVHAADIDDDGVAEVFTTALGELLTTVAAFDSAGEEAWTETLDGFRWSSELVDVTGDGSPELLVGAGVTDHDPIRAAATALDVSPDALDRVLWSVETGTPSWSFTTAEIDGELLVLTGGDNTRLDAIDATGALAWSWISGGFVNGVAAIDLDGDGEDEVVHVDGSGHLVASAAGATLWTRRIGVDGDGEATGIVTGDLEGDGAPDILVSGIRYLSEQAGVLERYDATGELIFSVTTRPFLFEPRLADLDGDGALEIVVAEAGFPGCGASAWSAEGEQLWQAVVGECILPSIGVGDADGDGDDEVAYGDTHWAPPYQIAMLDGDGDEIWKKELVDDDSYWVAVVPGGMLHGGFAPDGLGHVTKRSAAAGRIEWTHELDGIPDPDFAGEQLTGGSLHGALAPDLDRDGAVEILTDNYAGDVRLLDGATGEAVWITRLEPAGLERRMRHEGAAIAWVPATNQDPAWIVAGQGSFQRSRSATLALDADGKVVGQIERDGWATSAAVTSFGAVVGGGLGVHGLDAVPK